MPQLDFREALSTPEEKLRSHAGIAASSMPSVPIENPIDFFAGVTGLSRSTWANIVFVAIASLGGLFSAF